MSESLIESNFQILKTKKFLKFKYLKCFYVLNDILG